MNRLLRHTWQPVEGFRTHICIHCGMIRYYDNEFKRLMYKTKWKIWYYETPPCKRIEHCDHIEKPEKELINYYKHKNFIA